MISVEVPGATEDDVTVDAADHELSITVTRRSAGNQGHDESTAARTPSTSGDSGKGKLLSQEHATPTQVASHSTSTVSRRLTLPQSADVTAATATIKDGVVTVSVPKREHAIGKRIPLVSKL